MVEAPKGTFFKRGTKLPCRELGCTAAKQVESKECRHDLLPLRVLHGLINARQQGLGEAVAPKEIFFKRATKPPCRDLTRTVARPTKQEDYGHDLLPLSANHRLAKGV